MLGHDQNVKPIYYKQQGQNIEKNPVAIALSKLTPGEEIIPSSAIQPRSIILPISMGRCRGSLTLTDLPVTRELTYEVRIKAPPPKEHTLVKEGKAYATFPKEGAATLKDPQGSNLIEFNVPSKVQTFYKVSVDYRLVEWDSITNSWKPVLDFWKEDNIAKLDELILPNPGSTRNFVHKTTPF
jgi:hypothetical protein